MEQYKEKKISTDENNHCLERKENNCHILNEMLPYKDMASSTKSGKIKRSRFGKSFLAEFYCCPQRYMKTTDVSMNRLCQNSLYLSSNKKKTIYLQ